MSCQLILVESHGRWRIWKEPSNLFGSASSFPAVCRSVHFNICHFARWRFGSPWFAERATTGLCGPRQATACPKYCGEDQQKYAIIWCYLIWHFWNFQLIYYPSQTCSSTIDVTKEPYGADIHSTFRNHRPWLSSRAAARVSLVHGIVFSSWFYALPFWQH